MKRSIIILLVIFGILAARIAAHSAMVKVTLKPESEVRPAAAVTIKDIASIEGSKDLVRKVGDVLISTGPLPGSRRTIEASYIRARLTATGLGNGLAILGPSKAVISGKCVRFSSQELADEAVSFLREQLPGDNSVYDIIVQRAPRELIAAADSNAQIRPRLFGSTARPGVNTVALDLVCNGGVVATASAMAQVKVTSDVLVTLGPISAGQVLNPKSIATERRDITRVKDPLRVAHEDINDWVTRRAIPAGNVITLADVKPAPVVNEGDTVSLVVKCGHVTIRTSAQAKQDGGIGDTIRVLSEVSQQDLRARVIEPGLVIINR